MAQLLYVRLCLFRHCVRFRTRGDAALIKALCSHNHTVACTTSLRRVLVLYSIHVHVHVVVVVIHVETAYVPPSPQATFVVTRALHASRSDQTRKRGRAVAQRLAIPAAVACKAFASAQRWLPRRRQSSPKAKRMQHARLLCLPILAQQNSSLQARAQSLLHQPHVHLRRCRQRGSRRHSRRLTMRMTCSPRRRSPSFSSARLEI